MRSDRRVGDEEANSLATQEDAINGNAIDAAEAPKVRQLSTAEREEQRKIRRLQLMMDMVMSVIGQDESLTVDEAAEMVADSKKAALAMFPDKELAYNLIYKPRLQRLMRERFRIQ
jgi:hypothetical protein